MILTLSYSFSTFLSAQSTWVGLEKTQVDSASQVPVQEKPWECGPNALFRALVLQDIHVGPYDEFRDQCPRTMGNALLCKEVQTLAGSYLSGIIAVPQAAPYAECLADYAKTHSLRVDVQHHKLGKEHVALILNEDLALARPVLVLLGRGRYLHYVVVHGFDAASNTVKYIDTDNSERSADFAVFLKEMDMDRYRKLMSLGMSMMNAMLSEEQKQSIQTILSGYNIIRFLPKNEL